MCDKAIDNYSHALKLVSECYKTQKMIIFMEHKLFLIVIKLEKCVRQMLTCDLLYLILFLIYLILKKCVIKTFSKHLLW